jgi:hypothetical protein
LPEKRSHIEKYIRADRWFGGAGIAEVKEKMTCGLKRKA